MHRYLHFAHTHMRLLAEAGVLCFIALVLAVVIWRRTSPLTRGVLAVLLLVSYIGFRAWERRPPYEWGDHTVMDSVVEAGSNPALQDAPRIGKCPVFPADNVWNTPVEGMPSDKMTQPFIDSIGPLKGLHPDFGQDLNSGIPYSMIPAGTRPVPVSFEYSDDSDHGNYPIPANAPIEGGTASTGDRHVILIDERKCLLYELYDAHPQPDGSWKAGSGIKMDLTDNALRLDGKTSGDAAGLPILPGLVRYDEVAAGQINHAIRFTVPHTQQAHIWPARHHASHIKDKNVPPMGARFRLRGDFDLSKYSRTNQVILRAMQKYGIILADNGGPMFFSGVSDKRWDDSDLHKLNGVHADDFQLVDVSDWQMLPDSARVDPLSVRH